MNNELWKQNCVLFSFYSIFYSVYTSLDRIEWNGGMINELLLKCYVEGRGWSDFKHCSSVYLGALRKNT
jgi:hypothetical protein